MPGPSPVLPILRRLGRTLLILLAWTVAAVLAYSLARCGVDGALGWTALVLLVIGMIGWPAVLLAILCAAVDAVIHRSSTGGSAARLWGWVAAVALVLAVIGAAAGASEPRSCSIGF